MLGRGSFCDVIESVDPNTFESVAIKYPKKKEHQQLLVHEAESMRSLANCQSVPKLIDASSCPDFIVMQKVGKTLLSLHTELKQFSLKTIVMVAIKAITALEEIHTCGFVHRDVKPDNITVPLSPSDSRILFIDLGLSCRYVLNGTHVMYSEKNNFQGSPFFCSLNTLRNVKPTRRDDMEALGYVLVYLSGTHFPWLGCNPSSREFFTTVLKIREKVSTAFLCKGLEPEFAEYLTYCQNLGFSEKPNYEVLRCMFARLSQRFDFTLDWQYDWTKPTRFQRLKMMKSFSVAKDIESKPNDSRHKSRNHTAVQGSARDLHALRSKQALKLGVISSFEDLKGEESWDSSVTPVHRMDQLPAFRRPREHVLERHDTEEIDIETLRLPIHLRH